MTMRQWLCCCFTNKKETNFPPPPPPLPTTTKQTNKEQQEICNNILSELKQKYKEDEERDKELINELVQKNIGWKDCLPFVPPITKGLVIKVYDGDTITVASKLPYKESPMYRFSVRLNGIDCPEMGSKDKYEKECAEIAKQEMTRLVLNKVVTLKNIKTEKYGRILADVYQGDIHLNSHMLEKRLAVCYDGGTKKSPDNWIDYHMKG